MEISRSFSPAGVRQVKVIPLQHPPTYDSSPSLPSDFGSSAKIWLSKARQMSFIEWVELLLPCVRWIRSYKWKEYLQPDLMAGVTVGTMLVPQADKAPLPLSLNASADNPECVADLGTEAVLVNNVKDYLLKGIIAKFIGPWLLTIDIHAWCERLLTSVPGVSVNVGMDFVYVSLPRASFSSFSEVKPNLRKPSSAAMIISSTLAHFFALGSPNLTLTILVLRKIWYGFAFTPCRWNIGAPSCSRKSVVIWVGFLALIQKPFDGNLAAFARVCISVHASTPIPSVIQFSSPSGVWSQPFEVEKFIFRCFHCKQMGHKHFECLSKKPTLKEKWVPKIQTRPPTVMSPSPVSPIRSSSPPPAQSDPPASTDPSLTSRTLLADTK
ncbi:hypothetical protein KI387_019491 [Taxus chinensis]|uniref:CCHC-type domain-containing protein n=1 Tax=Taxus chinensis TaxID=29808 RepID=A0AA38LE72_TAXCH|nr:hypothetical protein KI387_019491 [Taxus chinensis]